MTYTTIRGDTWDLIARRVLGSEKFTPQLIEANPDYVEVFVFDSGIELQIPTISAAQVKQSALLWK